MPHITKAELVESPYLPDDIKTQVRESQSSYGFELQVASDVIDEALTFDVYSVDPLSGLPVDSVKAAAIKAATAKQMAYWLIIGVKIGRGAAGQGRKAASASINGATVTWDPNSSANAELEQAGSANPWINTSSLLILRRAGLASTRPLVSG